MTALTGEMESLEKTQVEFAHSKINHPFPISPIRLLFSFHIGRIILIISRHRIAFIYNIIG